MALMWNRTVDWDADDWRRSAACRDTEPDLFFPVGTTGPAVDQIDAAKRVCHACDALEPCLDFALGHQPGVGGLGRHVRGGTPQVAEGLAGRPPLAACRHLNPRRRWRRRRPTARRCSAHRGARTGTEMATRVPPPSATGTGCMEIVPSN